MLMQKARALRADLLMNGVAEKDLPKLEGKAAHAWLRRWETRYGINMGTTGLQLRGLIAARSDQEAVCTYKKGPKKDRLVRGLAAATSQALVKIYAAAPSQALANMDAAAPSQTLVVYDTRKLEQDLLAGTLG